MRNLFRHRNYTLYFCGQLVSMSGTWMQITAQSWLLYRMTGMSYWLGISSLCAQLPAFLVAPLAGLVADRVDRRRMLIVAETMGAIQAAILSALVFSHSFTVPWLLVLSTAAGVVGSFEMTARHSFVPELVPRELLTGAISLNGVIFNGARVIGPMAAGALIPLVGEAWCFAINSLSYGAVVLGLLAMRERVKSHKPLETKPNWADHLKQGVRYAHGDPLLREMLGLSAFVCLLPLSVSVIFPVFAKLVLHGGAATLGWITSLVGAGAVIGSILFVRSESSARMHSRIHLHLVLCGAVLVAFGASEISWLTYLVSLLLGMMLMALFPAMNNVIQHNVPDSMRGRISSLYGMTFLGTAPIGGFFTGWLTDHIGPRWVTVSYGFMTVAVGMVFILRRNLRRVRAGISGY